MTALHLLLALSIGCDETVDPSADGSFDPDTGDTAAIGDTADTAGSDDSADPIPESACPAGFPADVAGAHYERTYGESTVIPIDIGAPMDFNGVQVYPHHVVQSGKFRGTTWSDDTAWLYACTAEGVVRYGDIELYTQDGVTDTYTVVYDPPSVVWPAELALGTTWHIEGTGTWSMDAADGTHTDFGGFEEPEDYQVVATDSVRSVPVGDFATVEVLHTGSYNGSTYSFQEFAADGVGLVERADADGGSSFVLSACPGAPGCP
jgi:hypothetical protein